MAKKKKAPRRRDPNKIKLLNLVEAYTYSEILVQGTTNNNIMSFIKQDANVPQSGASYNLSSYEGGSYNSTADSLGVHQISLKDIMRNPSISMDAVRINTKTNAWSMVGKGLTTRIGFKAFKKIFAQPVRVINAQVFKPLALGVKL
tara:strand:- start:81 stop:518 length:438 start_codon:yes stop_codon:yes gene_type:complete